MSKTETSILGIYKKTILCHINNFGTEEVYVMEPITQEQEDAIDNSFNQYGEIRFVRNNGDILKKQNIKLYGDVNLDSEEDLAAIEKYQFIDENWRSFVYSNFDYERGVVGLIDGKFMYYPTKDPILWFKYNHCLIGKPDKIIIYKIPKINL